MIRTLSLRNPTSCSFKHGQIRVLGSRTVRQGNPHSNPFPCSRTHSMRDRMRNESWVGLTNFFAEQGSADASASTADLEPYFITSSNLSNLLVARARAGSGADAGAGSFGRRGRDGGNLRLTRVLWSVANRPSLAPVL